MKNLKAIIFVLLSLFIFNAFAVELYKCEFTATKKDNNQSWKKYYYLSETRIVHINFSSFNTEMDIIVSRDGKLSGSVNGQHQFILKGTPEQGYFESWAAFGSIKCESKIDFEAPFVFKPWKNIFIQGDTSTIINFNSPTDLVNGCFLGEAKASLAVLKDAFKANSEDCGLSSPTKIFVINHERRCLQWQGEYDNSICVKWDNEIRPYKYEINHCDFDPEPIEYDDPRS